MSTDHTREDGGAYERALSVVTDVLRTYTHNPDRIAQEVLDDLTSSALEVHWRYWCDSSPDPEGAVASEVAPDSDTAQASADGVFERLTEEHHALVGELAETLDLDAGVQDAIQRADTNDDREQS